MSLRRVSVFPLFVFLIVCTARPAHAVRQLPWGIGDRSGAQDVFVDLHGFLEGAYTKVPTSHDPKGHGTFDIPAFYLLPSAQLNGQFAAHAEIEFEHSASEIKLDRAWIQYTPLKDKGALAILVGRTYVPFIQEIEFYQAPLRLLVARPFAAKEIGFDEFQDIGLRVLGTIPTSRVVALHYDLGVYNGTKISRAFATGLDESDDLRDVNSHKLVAGRLGVNLASGQIKLSSGGFYDPNWAPGAATGATFPSYGVDGYLDILWKNVLLRGEWFRRVTEVFDGAHVDGTGWYAQLGYGWHPEGLLPVEMIRPVVQYDWLRITKDAQRRVAFGVVVFPQDYLQVKFEYDISRGDEDEADYQGLLTSVVAEF